MPDLEPVTGDPFSARLQPVSGDPFASMTHWPDQPAQPYMHPNVPAAAGAIAGFATGGLQGAGLPLPDWAASNPVQRSLQNPDNQAALGVASFVRNPAIAVRVDELLEQGYGQETIANKIGVNPSTIKRYLVRTGKKTAAMEEPIAGFWADNPGSVDVLKSELAKGSSHSEIAQMLGTNYDVVKRKVYRLRDAGELPGYQRQDRSILESPERQARLKELVDQGYSLRRMAQDEQLGATDHRQVKLWIDKLGLDWKAQPLSKSTSGAVPGMPKIRLEPVTHDPFSREEAADYQRELEKYLKTVTGG